MEIKVVAFDIYGTVLATDDWENRLPPRKGFVDFSKKLRDEARLVVSASDVSIDTQKKDLEKALRNYERVYKKRFELSDIFDGFFQLIESPKEFNKIIEKFNLKKEEFYIFGDNYNKDIIGAMNAMCRYFHVPEYRLLNEDKSYCENSFSFDGFVL